MKIYFLLLVASPEETLESLMSGRALRGRAITRGYFGVSLTNFEECFGPRGKKEPDIHFKSNQYFRNSLPNNRHE